MTTIAYRDGILVSDSAVTHGDTLVGTTRKIFHKPGVGAVASTGRLSIIAAMKRWLEAGAPFDDCPDLEGEALFVKEGGDEVYVVFEGEATQIAAPFYAGGSGADLARGAMAAGASAEQAVMIAAHMDINSNLPLQMVVMKQVIEQAPPPAADNDNAKPANVVPFRRKPKK